MLSVGTSYEGEQKLNYTEGRREHLWRLLQGEGPLVLVPRRTEGEAGAIQGAREPGERSSQRGEAVAAPSHTEPPPKRPRARIGERAPSRHPVGEVKHEVKVTRCSFSGVIDLAADHIQRSAVAKVGCPACGAMRTLHPQGDTVLFPSHTKRVTSPPPDEVRWFRRGTVWEFSGKQA